MCGLLFLFCLEWVLNDLLRQTLRPRADSRQLVQIPIVAIILGMVLGGIMEVKLRSSMARVTTPLDFIDRPISAAIFAIIVLVIVLHIRTAVKEYCEHK